MPADITGTDELVQHAARSDGSALSRLLDRHRERLRRAVAARLDRRLTARVAPSDIVQETMVDAVKRLPEYVRDQRVPYWVWLRRLALQRLVWWRRFHLESAKRSVARERDLGPSGFDHAGARLIDRLDGPDTSPSEHAIRNQKRDWVRAALERLTDDDRRVLELRYVEDLSFAQIADRLELELGAVKMRHRRAIERLGGLLDGRVEEF